MKTTLTWLKQYVDIDINPNDLAELLTMHGVEVESLTRRHDELDSVVVGKIVEIITHPHAKKLLLCQVYTGKDTYPVVCGAKNIKVNDLVPLALPGTTLPGGMKIERTTIRNVDSWGMLCSEEELGLGDDSSGIMVLPSHLRPGEKLISALGLEDYLFEFSITPNRPDLLSVIGIAREVGAILNKEVKYPHPTLEEKGGRIESLTSVTVEDYKLCPRYAARLLSNVTIKPSPFWIRDRLLSIGLRPINNVVDVTNYVLMEYGQPLHAFDFQKLAQNRIVVREAEDGEILTTLDDQERTLNEGMLVICDGLKPIALAGIMGGLDSEISENTSTVFIESAYFDPMCIRRTSKKLGIRTESSIRFEKGVDPEGVVLALNRVAYLMTEVSGGEIAKDMIDLYPQPFSEKEVVLRLDGTNRTLGTTLSLDHIRQYLAKIEVVSKKEDKNQLTFIPPSYRRDLIQEIDLIEEVARLHGYNNIPVSVPEALIKIPKKDEYQRFRNRVKELLIESGCIEVIAYSFISEKSFDKLNLPPADFRRRCTSIRNPLTEEQSVMRTTLLPGLLECMQHNAYQSNYDLKIFELGKIFINQGTDSLPEEIHMLSGLITGLRHDLSWYAPCEKVDFFDVKGSAGILLEQLGIRNTSYMKENCPPYLRKSAFCQVVVDGESLGFIGEVEPGVLSSYDLEEPAFIFDLNSDLMARHFSPGRKYQPLPKYPAVVRDLALVVEEDFEFGHILDSIAQFGSRYVEDVQVFDLYRGKQIGPGKKGLTLRIIYRSQEGTLEDTEVNEIHREITSKLLEKFGVELRR